MHDERMVPPLRSELEWEEPPAGADGPWRLERWQTWRGKRTRSEGVMVADGRLVLRVPRVGADVAFKLRRGR